jgi:phosphoribosylformylglycinamidine cyclo-ligase
VGCTLLGGETAEMPGFYQPGEYDLAGFCVGIAEKSQILDGSQVQVGDVAIALPSSGIHSNGYSLVRKIVEVSGTSLDATLPEFAGKSLGEVLLTPTQIYVKAIVAALKANLPIHGMAHITGGGLPENLPRCLTLDQSIRVDANTWTTPPVFEWLAKTGNVERAEMFNTFNMGVGFVVLVPTDQVNETSTFFQQQGLEAWTIGEVVAGDRNLILDL